MLRAPRACRGAGRRERQAPRAGEGWRFGVPRAARKFPGGSTLRVASGRTPAVSRWPIVPPMLLAGQRRVSLLASPSSLGIPPPTMRRHDAASARALPSFPHVPALRGDDRIGPTMSCRSVCGQCGFVLFFNAAAAVAAFVTRDGRPRAVHPAGEGPGSRQAGAARRVRRLRRDGRGGHAGARSARRSDSSSGPLTYLASFPNLYVYAGRHLPHARRLLPRAAAGDQEPQALDAVESVCWLDPREVELEDIAFPSMQSAVVELRRRGR